MNTPYRRQYDKNGELTNPLPVYHSFPNRSERRLDEKANSKKGAYKFRGNNKGASIITYGSNKKRRVLQLIIDKRTGERKTIKHIL